MTFCYEQTEPSEYTCTPSGSVCPFRSIFYYPLDCAILKMCIFNLRYAKILPLGRRNKRHIFHCELKIHNSIITLFLLFPKNLWFSGALLMYAVGIDFYILHAFSCSLGCSEKIRTDRLRYVAYLK